MNFPFPCQCKSFKCDFQCVCHRLINFQLFEKKSPLFIINIPHKVRELKKEKKIFFSLFCVPGPPKMHVPITHGHLYINTLLFLTEGAKYWVNGSTHKIKTFGTYLFLNHNDFRVLNLQIQ